MFMTFPETVLDAMGSRSWIIVSGMMDFVQLMSTDKVCQSWENKLVLCLLGVCGFSWERELVVTPF